MHIDKIKSILLNDLFLEKVYVSVCGDHYQIIAVDKMFCNKNKLEQHKIVYAPLTKYIMNNNIHAISIYTFSPEEWNIQRKYHQE